MSNFNTHDFEPCSSAAWKQKIQVDLKGADYNETLLTNTSEGITIKPFYHSDSFEKLDIPVLKEDFKIAQRIAVDNVSQANEMAKNAVRKGVDSLLFSAKDIFDIDELFDGLTGRKLIFHFQFEFLDDNFLNEILSNKPDEIIYYNLDCIGHLYTTGNWFKSMQSDLTIIQNFCKAHQEACVLGINLTGYQNAGANCVQQVAYALAHVNEYLNQFTDLESLPVQLNVAVGNNYFFEVAKIRALRYLTNMLWKEFGLKGDIHVFAEPGLRNKSIYDYNVNLLRTTTESMSAILGGATTIANQPYDQLFHEDKEFGQRIARNQLLILKDESYFREASEFATNAYYIESITIQIAEKALTLFKEIETSGGFIKQIFEGTIQRKIKEIAQKEQELFDSGKLTLLGTNKFPNASDSMKGDLKIDPFTKRRAQKTLVEPIIPKRLAAEYELNRLENEA
jgi:methylmalonyl-CoA mutase